MLGAGPNQLPGITKACELGHHVITADYSADSVGHQYSHQNVVCSVTDREGILEHAKNLDINGVVTFAELACPAVGYVAENLGLPGANLDTVNKMLRKDLFRKAQHSAKLNAPWSVTSTTTDELLERLKDKGPPFVIKPADSTSSRGLSILSDPSSEDLRSAFLLASQHSRSGVVCAEAFIPGTEVGGDAFIVDGKLAFSVITHKHTENNIPVGHSVPTNISEDHQEILRTELEKACAAVGYKGGALNFDAIVSQQRATIVEMSPRLGANGIPDVIKCSTGVDMIEATIQSALGIQTEFPPIPLKLKPSGSLVVRSKNEGTLQNIATVEELKAKVPGLYAMFSHAKPGDTVSRFEHGGNGLGYVVFDVSGSTYSETSEQILAALNLTVE